MNNLITCPICDFKSENLTTHIILIHNMTTKEFKKKFKLKYIKSDRLRQINKNNIDNNNPTKGTVRSFESKQKMSQNRTNKGVGIAGKYERTPEIKEKISSGVIKAHLRGDFDNVRPGISNYVYSSKMQTTFFTRSSWEADLVQILDKHPRVISFKMEPFKIPYYFENCLHNYIPDFLVVYDDCITSIWEVKRDDFIINDEKSKAKILALHEYGSTHQMNTFVVDSKILKLLKKYIKGL